MSRMTNSLSKFRWILSSLLFFSVPVFGSECELRPGVNFTYPELKDLVKAGSMIILHTKTTPLTYNQISDLGLASAEAGVVILCVDAPRFANLS